VDFGNDPTLRQNCGVRHVLTVLQEITGLTEVELRTSTYETPCYKISGVVLKIRGSNQKQGRAAKYSFFFES
jgi:hypothetical protein